MRINSHLLHRNQTMCTRNIFSCGASVVCRVFKYRFCYNFRFLRNIVNQRDLMARPKKTKSISEIQNTKWIEKEETSNSIKPIMEKNIVVNRKKRKFKIHSAFRTMALCLWLGFCHVDGRKKTHFGYVFRLPNFIHVFKIAPKNCIP